MRSERDAHIVEVARTTEALNRAEERAREAREKLQRALKTRNASELDKEMRVDAAIRRVLLLEPDGSTRASMRNLLRLSGYEAATAQTAEDAIALMRGTPYDLLLAEIYDVQQEKPNIPEGSAEALLREAKQRDIPVIGVTVLNERDAEDRRLLRRFDHMGLKRRVSKPVDWDTLRSMIRAVATERAKRPN